ncbi:MAG: 50S ribosomal protein L25 [Bacteroidota bacterium]
MELMLEAEIRAEKGTGAAHALRRQGLIPAVVYSKTNTEMLKLSLRATERLVAFAGTGRLVNLAIKRGKKTEKTPVLIKELQRNPIRGEIIHVDFHAVALDKPITTHVPVHIAGEEKRLNDGAFIEAYLREVEVSCLPTKIPDSFTVDVSGLAMGASIHVKDLTPPAGVKIISSPEEVVVAAVVPSGAAEAAPAEPGAAEPQLVAEKKEEEK